MPTHTAGTFIAALVDCIIDSACLHRNVDVEPIFTHRIFKRLHTAGNCVSKIVDSLDRIIVRKIQRNASQWYSPSGAHSSKV